ncbi:MAG: hypothetical protein N7Q72_06610 [Spiroplasma sp. Tabriz.8]|nr:hypothetical protein [Spiroplasma sp. Tabriz.8]
MSSKIYIYIYIYIYIAPTTCLLQARPSIWWWYLSFLKCLFLY